MSFNMDEQPPIFKTWAQWYALVLITLVILILVFYWFTVSFS
jgi:hypothetical protein